MAVTVIKDLTDLWDGQTLTGWSRKLNNPEHIVPRHGTGCYGLPVSNTTTHTWRTYTSTNLSNQNIYIWMMLTVTNTLSNGGARIVLGDGTNRRAYYVGGSDVPGFQFNQWSCYMLDTSNLPTLYAQLLGTGEPNLSSITEVGVGFSTTYKALGGSPNCMWDIGRYGKGLIIQGGTENDPGTFEDIALDDASSSNGKAYGIIRKIQPGLYACQGTLTFGDSTGTNSTYFKDTNILLGFENNGAGNNTYEINVVGNSTGDNVFILGDKLGTGDNAVGTNGCTVQSSGPDLKINFTGTNVNTLNIYGTTLYNCKKTIDLSTNTEHEFIGNTISKSGQVIANNCLIRNCFFNNTISDNSALLWNNDINIKNSDFIGNRNISSSDLITYTINMTDTYGDGWNGTVIGFEQNDVIIETFGEEFTTGSEFGPIYINLPPNTLTNIVVSVVGTYPTEVGFTVHDSGNNLIYQRTPATFDINTIFHTFTTPDNTNTTIGNVSAIEHESGSTYDYYDLNFSNNDYDILNSSNNILNINNIGISNATTYYNSGTSTTTINNVRYFRLTGLKENTEIRLIRKSDLFQIAGIENSGTEYEYQYNYTSDIEIYVHIHNLQYEFIRLESILSSTNTTIPIQQIFDRNYKNPS